MSDEIKNDLLKGNRRALAKAITLVESTNEKHQKQGQALIEEILPFTGKSFRIGISGPPGVGKSTFIEKMGQLMIEQEQAKVAVLAVDPSSPRSGGSLLADKTRMEQLSQSDSAFIRPSPAASALGGVANKTREALLLCEAAGYDHILIETVGVGQSEHEVRNMVDFFITLIQPNSGDELQGIKKGILELSQLVIVNKCDGDNVTDADVSAGHYKNALSLQSFEGQWKPPVLKCSSTTGEGLPEILEVIKNYAKNYKDEYMSIRREQNISWFKHLSKEQFEKYVTEKMADDWQALSEQVRSGQLSPIAATDSLFKKI